MSTQTQYNKTRGIILFFRVQRVYYNLVLLSTDPLFFDFSFLIVNYKRFFRTLSSRLPFNFRDVFIHPKSQGIGLFVKQTRRRSHCPCAFLLDFGRGSRTRTHSFPAAAKRIRSFQHRSLFTRPLYRRHARAAQ